MSDELDRVFYEERIVAGIRQKPNWAGVVWGKCQTKGCGNHNKIGEYIGGFCKRCSTRVSEDQNIPIISSIKTSGGRIPIANPQIRWIEKKYVKDMSHALKGKARAEFYMTPEQRQKREDRVDYTPEKEEDEI